MQQLDMMDIAGNKIGVKVAPMSAGETAQLAANAARMDLDDEGDFLDTLTPNIMQTHGQSSLLVTLFVRH